MRIASKNFALIRLTVFEVPVFLQAPAGTLQQSADAAGSLLPASRTTFQLPSACLRQMVM
jgi:hypothetical protein